MAKKKTTSKKAIESNPANKAQKVETENKTSPQKKYNGYIIINGLTYKMGEARARQMVKDGKAKFA